MQKGKYNVYLFNCLIVNKNKTKLLLLLPKLALMAIIAMLCFLIDDIYRMTMKYIHAPAARFVQDLFKPQSEKDTVKDTVPE